jgi:hypothetical protein
MSFERSVVAGIPVDDDDARSAWPPIESGCNSVKSNLSFVDKRFGLYAELQPLFEIIVLTAKYTIINENPLI